MTQKMIGSILFASLLISFNAAASGDVEGFYGRLVADLQAGKPMVTTVYVALCDNDSQGIVPVKNRSICDGDVPDQNMYWRGSGGIQGYMKKQGWKKVHRSTGEGTILVTEVWKKTLFPGKAFKKRGVKKPFVAYTVALAYRGSNIHEANLDYLRAVNTDKAQTVTVKGGTEVTYGGAGHVAGYIGHDYFMDAWDGTKERKELDAIHKKGDSKLAKGTFALACVSHEFMRPAVTRDNVYIFALNNFLTFPSAWTVGGIIAGIAIGGTGKDIYVSATNAFAEGRKCGKKWARQAFSYGPEAE